MGSSAGQRSGCPMQLPLHLARVFGGPLPRLAWRLDSSMLPSVVAGQR